MSDCHEKSINCPGKTEKGVEAVVKELLGKEAWVDVQLHHKEHEWLRLRIAQEEAKKEAWKKASEWIAQWTVLGILGWLLNYIKGS